MNCFQALRSRPTNYEDDVALMARHVLTCEEEGRLDMQSRIQQNLEIPMQELSQIHGQIPEGSRQGMVCPSVF